MADRKEGGVWPNEPRNPNRAEIRSAQDCHRWGLWLGPSTPDATGLSVIGYLSSPFEVCFHLRASEVSRFKHPKRHLRLLEFTEHLPDDCTLFPRRQCS
jgi:hypothetical protein